MKRSILSSITPFVATALLLSGPFQTHAQDVDPTESGSTNQTQEAADVVVETTNGASTDAAVTTAEVPAASAESAADEPAADAPSETPVVAPADEPADEPAAATADETSGTTFERAATDPVDTAAQSPADPPAATTSGAATAAAAVTMTQMYDMLQKQQSQLDAQKRQIEDQKKLIVALQVGADKELQTEKDVTAKQAEEIESQRQTMASMQTQIDQINQKSAADLSKEDVELRSRLETLESSIQASQDAASTTFDEDSFPNSTMIPGTNAAMRMGGFVKMNIVETFDPLASLDRFIANSIPVPQESTTPRTSMTVSQSRLNWDLRDKTKFGVMRAYIEGDFAGDSTTFRLRHAFGQFKDVLAGKTWSVFQDVDAMPEELDFEGINGAVNVRQSQVRYFPKVGGDWNLMFSLEDPNPEITAGTATSKIPDLVASARRTWFDRWHIRSSVVLRQITGIWDFDTSGDTESQVTGWGLSFSGKTATQFWNDTGSDNFLFQLNAGKGIGRYINDLNTLGGQDAIFDVGRQSRHAASFWRLCRVPALVAG